MKRRIRVSTCTVCGHKANTSKWWTKAKNGKIYYYMRFYHSPKNIHLVPTDSNYSTPLGIRERREDLYAELQDFIRRKMGSRRYSFTSLKREFERFYGHIIYNVSFCRAIDKAMSSRLVMKIKRGTRPVYLKEPNAKLDEMIRFDKFIINYDLTKKFVKISVFLEATNVGRLHASSIPLYIPNGMVDSVDKLHLQIKSEDGEIPSRDSKIIVSNALETIVSISLLKVLKYGEHKFVFASYEVPLMNNMLKLVTQENIGLLRINVIVSSRCESETVRTLVDGAKDSVSSFQKRFSYSDECTYFQSEFEGIYKGESISVNLKSRQILSSPSCIHE